MDTIERTPAGRPAHETLVRCRDLVDPALREAVASLPASTRRIAGYHFGWWDEEGHPATADGGKAIRPALVLLAAEAVGGTPSAAVPAAVVVELTHNFSLLHDDVIDGDTTRRHRPTAWSVFGKDSAILAGDALLTLAFDVLAASGHAGVQDGVRMLGTAVQELVDGQYADVAFERRADVGLPECVRMAEGKTGALLGCACALGALFGGGTPDQIAHLRGFGEQLGLAFQLVDDLLGIWGNPAVTGKPTYSDLHNRKKSLPVVAALTSGSPAGHELATLYRRDQPLSGADVAHAAELIDTAGGRVWSQTQVDDLLTRALERLHAAGPVGRAAADLETLARKLTRRDR